MTQKTELECLQDIPNIDALAQNFTFIDDLTLRKNIAIVFQYIIFLITLEKNHSLPGAVSYVIYKDMIIHTASITESLLCYGLKKALEKGKTTIETMDIEENIYKDFIKIREISSTEIVGGVTKVKKYVEPQDMQFNDLIPAAIHIGLINPAFENELKIIRQSRNRVHLSSLSRVDNLYTKEEVDNMFATVKKLKTSIISYLN